MKNRRIAPLLAGLAATLLSLAIYGYTGEDNAQHRQFRPRLEAVLDPALYPNDPFVRTLDRIPTFFWSGSAAVLKATGLDPDAWFFALYLLSLGGVYGMIFLLGRELGGSERAGWLAAALAVLSNHLHFYSLLSHDTLIRDRADQTLLAWPLLLGAVLLRSRRRPASAYAAIGAAANLQPMLAASLGLACGAADLPELKRNPRRIALGWALMAAAALPVLMNWLGAPAAKIGSAEWAELLRLWFPYHYFPSSWPAAQWLYIAGHCGALAALFAAGFGGVRRRPELGRLVGGMAALGAVYVFFSEGLPWRPVILLQSLRLDGLATLLCLLAGAAVLDRLVREGRWAWAGLLWTALANPHRTILPLPLLVPVLIRWAREPRSVGKSDGWVRTYLGLLAAFSAARLGAGFQASGLYPMESAGLIALFAGLALLRRPGRATRAVLLLAGVAAVALPFFEIGGARWIGRARAAADPVRQERRVIEGWLREHTAKNAVVLAAPLYHDLRLGSRRSNVAEFLDGAALHWAPDYGPIWRRRMEDLGYLFEEAREAASRIDIERFPLRRRGSARAALVRPWDLDRQKRLLEVYRPDVVVMPFAPAHPALSLAISTGRFSIYRVEKDKI